MEESISKLINAITSSLIDDNALWYDGSRITRAAVVRTGLWLEMEGVKHTGEKFFAFEMLNRHGWRNTELFEKLEFKGEYDL
jgi:hypothetical protein